MRAGVVIRCNSRAMTRWKYHLYRCHAVLLQKQSVRAWWDRFCSLQLEEEMTVSGYFDEEEAFGHG